MQSGLHAERKVPARSTCYPLSTWNTIFELSSPNDSGLFRRPRLYAEMSVLPTVTHDGNAPPRPALPLIFKRLLKPRQMVRRRNPKAAAKHLTSLSRTLS